MPNIRLEYNDLDYDYNDNEDYGYPQKSRFPLGKILKYIFFAFLVCFVIALSIRLYTSSYYPSDMKKIYFNDTLTEHYFSTDNFEAYTQELGYHYDDPDYEDNYFFADHLIYIPEAKQLQVTLRYNDSALPKLATKYGLEQIPEASPDLFLFTLSTLCEEIDENGEKKTVTRRYDCSYLYTDEKFMYNYIKLVFDGVEFDEETAWLRVDTYFAGHETPDEDEPLAKNLVWQQIRPSKKYKLAKSEVPTR